MPNLLAAARKLPPMSRCNRHTWDTRLARTDPAKLREIQDLCTRFLHDEFTETIPSKMHLLRFLRDNGIKLARTTFHTYLEKLQSEIENPSPAGGRVAKSQQKTTRASRRQGPNKATRKATGRTVRSH